MIKACNDQLFKSQIQFNIITENCFHFLKCPQKIESNPVSGLNKRQNCAGKKKRVKKSLAKHKSEPPGLGMDSLPLTMRLPYFSLWERED